MCGWILLRVVGGGEKWVVWMVSFHVTGVQKCALPILFFFFFKQKTAYEIVSRDWSSDVCSSDLYSFYSGTRIQIT